MNLQEKQITISPCNHVLFHSDTIHTISCALLHCFIIDSWSEGSCIVDGTPVDSSRLIRHQCGQDLELRNLPPSEDLHPA